MTKKFKFSGHLFWYAAKRLYLENYTSRASALAYTTLLSLVPLISVMLYILSFFSFFKKYSSLVEAYIFTNFVPTSGDIIRKYLDDFLQHASTLPWFGIAFSVITSFILIITIEQVLNDIWKVKLRKKPVPALILYWLLLFLIPIFIGASILFSSFIFSLSWLSFAKSILLIGIIPILINTVIFAVLYVVVPSRSVNWMSGLIGGLIAALLFEIAKKGFAIYIMHINSYEIIYGTLSTALIFLIWIYLSWLIVLYGALLTYEMRVVKKKI